MNTTTIAPALDMSELIGLRSEVEPILPDLLERIRHDDAEAVAEGRALLARETEMIERVVDQFVDLGADVRTSATLRDALGDFNVCGNLYAEVDYYSERMQRAAVDRHVEALAEALRNDPDAGPEIMADIIARRVREAVEALRSTI